MNYYLPLLLSIIISYYYFSSFSQYNDNQIYIDYFMNLAKHE